MTGLHALLAPLKLLAMPSNLLLAALALGLGLSLARRRLGPPVAAAAAAGLALAILLPVGGWLRHGLEERHPRRTPERVDGVVVLGGGPMVAMSKASGTPAWGEHADRLLAMAELMRRYPGAVFVYSDGGTDPAEFDDNRALARAAMAELKFDLDRVVFESRSTNTRDNARLSLAIARPRPDQQWLLVTSAAHMPRALAAFRRAGWSRIAPWPVDYRSAALHRWPILASERLADLDAAVYEILGYLAYFAEDVVSASRD